MYMEFIILFLGLALFLTLNLIRFYFSDVINKLILIFGSSLLIAISLVHLNEAHLLWMGLFFIFIMASSFKWKGAVISALSLLVLFSLVPVSTQISYLWISAFYMIFSLIMGLLFEYLHRERTKFDRWQKQFYRQSKNLHILREVSLALQSTLNLDKLLHIFLTAITAGYGLGYNRALLFLAKDSYNTFEGKLGIGPLSVEQGHKIWENVVVNKLTLKDFIQLQEKAKLDDHELNKMLRSLSFQVSDENDTMSGVIHKKEPVIIEEHTNDPLVRQIRETFSMEQFAVVPLLNRGKVVGVLMIDNIVNGKEIKKEEMDNIMPLATQAAMAIENASLYRKTEEMAITDGLTKLYNKRFLDRMLPHLFESAKTNENPLSAIVIDIDHFKVYNDTHGHLLGNDVLIKLADILKNHFGHEDLVCRFGGEEFVIILPMKDEKETCQLAESVRAKVEKAHFYGEARQPNGSVTVSVGVASFPSHVSDIHTLIDHADKALYAAKSSGKNRVNLYEGVEVS
ncbi:sensor domain-containing diguanylate cyclase [Bacillus shivajii]|uniref:sensor domain-containing diguanylate cyclase n=1 Tax=Bacillus shivajii TaxID=1983719 RepID=UPI001CFBF8B3|nr:sensor domain-containing diguanylate cyclase [Bacillus shivajii]UCZ54849.1 sensor domain-containing diguanylate cyclase [Bacillus shivajii]